MWLIFLPFVQLLTFVSSHEIPCFVEDDNITLICTGTFPIYIPVGISRVQIQGVSGFTVTLTDYRASGWEFIEHLTLVDNTTYIDSYPRLNLTLTSGCFNKLSSLVELFVIGGFFLNYEHGIFDGLSKLQVLCLQNCGIDARFGILNEFDDTNVLPKLEVVKLTNIYGKFLVFNSRFIRNLLSRPIKVLDFSQSRLESFDFHDLNNCCKSLEILNISDISIIHDTSSKLPRAPAFPNLRVIDVSGLYGDRHTLQGFMCWRNFGSRRHFVWRDKVVEVQTKPFYCGYPRFESIVLDRICGTEQFKITDIRNITLMYPPSQPKCIQIKNVYSRYNDVPIVDAELNLVALQDDVEFIDISHNNNEYLNPKVLSSLFKVKTLNISSNRLHNMLEKSPMEFEQLLLTFAQLEVIRIADNGFKTIPRAMFNANMKLKVIDISSNKLTSIDIELQHLTKLQMLDVSGNQLRTIAQQTKLTMQAMAKGSWINLGQIVFQCSACVHLKNINDLFQFSNHILNMSAVGCYKSFDPPNLIQLKLEVRHELESLCRSEQSFRSAIISGGVVFVTVVIAVIAGFISVRRWRKITQRKDRRQDRLAMLNDNDNDLRFAVFLSYANQDEEFVSQNVYGPLNQTFRDITGIDRDLVATGDRNFVIGNPIFKEIFRCIRESAVIAVFVTENFCRSEFCCREFEIAFQHHKPIVLMMKDAVDREIMPLEMKQLFEQYVRIVWRFVNGRYELQGSWGDKCEAMLQM
ncbi:hypothetical protein DPMN_113044 [Dreissena polymorpha]|uniref:TIR domain-containing protein n=1 Tax=Dreissena polymorpha TaxID=45954 RepID=A0A9D4QR79_DREPO|nr:hypothetical protein DPMN_113044 [Dreissena polymorpha]